MIVLGVDGGGSSTRAVLADERGTVLGRGAAGPCNPLVVGAETAAQAVDAAVDAAWLTARRNRRPADAAAIGLAGLLGAPLRRDMRAALAAGSLVTGEPGSHSRLQLTHDLHIALRGGLAGDPGVVLVAGTGSAAYACPPARAGETRADAGGPSEDPADGADPQGIIVGGKGALAGDSGSAYWVAHRALRAAVRQLDGRSPRTGLTDVVLEFFDAHDGDELALRLYSELPRAFELARLCPRVVRLASDDTAAAAIVHEAQERLAEMAAVACTRAGLAAPAVVVSGGLAVSESFRPGLETAVSQVLPGASFPPRALPPVGGALLDALRLAGSRPDKAVVKRIGEAL